MEKIHVINTVIKEFDFLTNFQFVYNGFEDLNRDLLILFKKNEMMVEIQYNKANDYIEVIIYNNISETNRINDKWKWSINLDWLINKYEQNKVIFKFENLDETIKYKAYLLKKYGSDILSGKEWFSWGDVSGWKPGNQANITIDYKTPDETDL